MEKFNFKKKTELKIRELESDLQRFNQDWEKLKAKKQNVQDKPFLDRLSKDILTLDRHAKEVSSISKRKECANLIHYILKTPWGAPFVSQTTLLEAASIYEDQQPMKSALHDLISDISDYSEKCDIPFLKNLQMIGEEIQKWKKDAA